MQCSTEVHRSQTEISPGLELNSVWTVRLGEQIVAHLLLSHLHDEPVFVVPPHEDKIYRYYLLRDGASPEAVESLAPTSDEQILDLLSLPEDRLFLTAPSTSADSLLDQLQRMNLRPLVEPAEKWNDTRYLFVRE